MLYGTFVSQMVPSRDVKTRQAPKFHTNRRLACRDGNGFMEHTGALLENWTGFVRQLNRCRWTQRLPDDDDQEFLSN